MNHTIYTDHSLDEGETIIPDTLYEVDYDVSALATLIVLTSDTFLLILYTKWVMATMRTWANTLIVRNVIDFPIHKPRFCLIEQLYARALTTELRNANEHNWRSLRWESLKKFVPYIIVDEIQSLGLNVAHGPTLQGHRNIGSYAVKSSEIC